MPVFYWTAVSDIMAGFAALSVGEGGPDTHAGQGVVASPEAMEDWQMPMAPEARFPMLIQQGGRVPASFLVRPEEYEGEWNPPTNSGRRAKIAGVLPDRHLGI